MFTPDKFILGLSRLTINNPPQKIRKSFKVYKPAVNPILYDCKAMEDVLLVVFAEVESRARGRPVPQRALPVELSVSKRSAVDSEEGGPHEAKEREA